MFLVKFFVLLSLKKFRRHNLLIDMDELTRLIHFDKMKEKLTKIKSLGLN